MEKNITIKSIADILSVSTTTVSNALNNKGRLNENLKKKIIKIASDLDYKQNIIARTLSLKKSWTIGVIVPEMLIEYFFQIIMGMEEIASRKDYTLVFANTSYNLDKEIKDIDKFTRMLIDGLIIIGGSGKINHLSKLLNNMPTVLVARHINTMFYPSVLIDDRDAQVKAVTYLRNLGHRDIGYMGIMPKANVSITNIELRTQGYLDGLKLNNLKYSPQNLFFKSSEKYVSKIEDIYDFLKHNLFVENFKTMPTAILTQNDYIAIGLMKILKEKGIRVPEDVSVMGYDNLNISSFTNPTLTTTKQPKRELGIEGINLLLEIIEKNEIHRKNILLATEIIERESTIKI